MAQIMDSNFFPESFRFVTSTSFIPPSWQKSGWLVFKVVFFQWGQRQRYSLFLFVCALKKKKKKKCHIHEIAFSSGP